MTRFAGLVLASLFALRVPGALAQDTSLPPPASVAPESQASPPASEPAAPIDPNQVTAPQLQVFVDAGYPDAARPEKLEASVLIRVVVGTDGYVESAELVNAPVGNGFDELALSAVRRFLFVPAMKGGVPVRARITYRYDFTFQPPAEPIATATEPPVMGDLELSVLNAEGKPVRGAEILLSSPSSPNFAQRLVSDENGKAISKGLAPGRYDARVSAEGFVAQDQAEEIVAGEITAVTYRLSEAEQTDDWSFGAVARVRAPPREVTRRTIVREELTRVAGTRGDALRTIELLPGVSRPPFGAGLVLIRGSAPGDSQVFLDGVPVPILYHFGGLTSFINSRALERIDFYPGNFSARYGRQLGGIVDVEMRDPQTDGYHGVLDVNLPLDASLLVEGPIGDKASFLVAGRRSYFGEILAATIPPDTFSAFAAPVYYDYQTFATYRPTNKDRLKFGVYGSSDRLEVLFADVPDSDPSVRSVEAGLSFHRQQVSWDRQYNKDLDHRITLSFGRTSQQIAVGTEVNFDLEVNNISSRAEWRYRLTDRVQVIAGTDTFIDIFDVKYTGPVPGQQEGGNNSNQTLQQLPVTSVRDQRTRVLPAGYLELLLRPTEKLLIVPGMRLDYYQDNAAFTFDPRLSSVYSITDDWRVKAGVGVFSQPPEPQESSPLLGNAKLRPIRSVHYSVGVDHDFTDALSLGMEGFYKHIYDRVVSGTNFGEPVFINDGVGRIYGLEVSGRAKPKGRFFGFLSYTLMRSERNDRNEGYRLFDFDQTHILTLSAGVRLGKGWEAGGTFRYVTGNPTTPVTGSYFDANTGLYYAQSGRINSTRNPPFNRLDLRVEKLWTFDRWRLAAYLDVQNTYNAENPEGTQYSYNYQERGPLRGLVILPIIGLRGEL